MYRMGNFIFCTGMSVCVCVSDPLPEYCYFSPLKEIIVFLWSIISRMGMSVW